MAAVRPAGPPPTIRQSAVSASWLMRPFVLVADRGSAAAIALVVLGLAGADSHGGVLADRLAHHAAQVTIAARADAGLHFAVRRGVERAVRLHPFRTTGAHGDLLLLFRIRDGG